MTTIIPRREILRRAVRWISEQRVEHPRQSLASILDAAAFRYDLTPAEQEWLRATFGR